jgi:hypothetical protein
MLHLAASTLEVDVRRPGVLLDEGEQITATQVKRGWGTREPPTVPAIEVPARWT